MEKLLVFLTNNTSKDGPEPDSVLSSVTVMSLVREESRRVGIRE